jgi:hypothetical protein
MNNLFNAWNMNNIKISKPVFKIRLVTICLVNFQFHIGLKQVDALFSLYFCLRMFHRICVNLQGLELCGIY